MNSNQDIFCSIVNREAPSFIIAENDLALAFLDREPATEGHTLIITKRHTDDIGHVSAEEFIALMNLAQKVANILQTKLGFSSTILHQVNGKGAQDVRHFHLHVYGGPQITPYFFEQFETSKELDSSLASTQEKMI